MDDCVNVVSVDVVDYDPGNHDRLSSVSLSFTINPLRSVSASEQ